MVPVRRQYRLNRAAWDTLTWVLTVRKFRLSHFICRVLASLKPSTPFHETYCSTPVYYSTAVISTEDYSKTVVFHKVFHIHPRSLRSRSGATFPGDTTPPIIEQTFYKVGRTAIPHGA